MIAYSRGTVASKTMRILVPDRSHELSDNKSSLITTEFVRIMHEILIYNAFTIRIIQWWTMV